MQYAATQNVFDFEGKLNIYYYNTKHTNEIHGDSRLKKKVLLFLSRNVILSFKSEKLQIISQPLSCVICSNLAVSNFAVNVLFEGEH